MQAFIINRITYVAPFLALKKAEQDNLNCIIQKAYKQAAGIPIAASTERFEAMGIHNTLDELPEAQRIAQLRRLSSSATGPTILQQLKISYASQHGEKVMLAETQRVPIRTFPRPRNMHPVHNVDRPLARAAALHRRLRDEERVLYVDSAEYPDRAAMAIVAVDKQGN